MTLEVKRSGHWPFYKYELLDDFEYTFIWLGQEYKRTIPKGWIFDGATFGWLIGLRKEASMEPAAIHDDMYNNKGMMKTDDGRIVIVCKSYADDLYMAAIDDTEEGGVNTKSWQRALVRAAFATFGNVFWIT